MFQGSCRKINKNIVTAMSDVQNRLLEYLKVLLITGNPGKVVKSSVTWCNMAIN